MVAWADHGHQFMVPARLCPEHAEAALGLVEGDPLNQACENFACSLLARHSEDTARAASRLDGRANGWSGSSARWSTGSACRGPG